MGQRGAMVAVLGESRTEYYGLMIWLKIANKKVFLGCSERQQRFEVGGLLGFLEVIFGQKMASVFDG